MKASVVALILEYIITVQFVFGQYAFIIDDIESKAIYSDIEAGWKDWATVGNEVLASAKKDHPSAWSQLTEVYGTDELPVLFKVELAQHAAGHLAGVKTTTIWDGDIQQQDEFDFSTRDISIDATTTWGPKSKNSNISEAETTASTSNDRGTGSGSTNESSISSAPTDTGEGITDTEGDASTGHGSSGSNTAEGEGTASSLIIYAAVFVIPFIISFGQVGMYPQ